MSSRDLNQFYEKLKNYDKYKQHKLEQMKLSLQDENVTFKPKINNNFNNNISTHSYSTSQDQSIKNPGHRLYDNYLTSIVSKESKIKALTKIAVENSKFKSNQISQKILDNLKTKRITKLFQLFDRNNNGSITREETYELIDQFNLELMKLCYEVFEELDNCDHMEFDRFSELLSNKYEDMNRVEKSLFLTVRMMNTDNNN